MTSLLFVYLRLICTYEYLGHPKLWEVHIHMNTLATLGAVPEFIDPVFAKTSPKRAYTIIKTSVLGLFLRNWAYEYVHRKLRGNIKESACR